MRRWKQRLDIVFAWDGALGLSDLDSMPIMVFEQLAAEAANVMAERLKEKREHDRTAPRVR